MPLDALSAMLLPLDDRRWATLLTHFGDASNVPDLLRAWQAAIGTPTEEAAYKLLFEHALHQLGIMSCTYAVVPYLVAELPRCALPTRIELLGHVGVVESARPRSEADRDRQIQAFRDTLHVEMPHLSDELRDLFIANAGARSPLLPPDLEPAYRDALEAARTHATALLRVPAAPQDTARLLGAITAIFAPTERKLALALMQPGALWIDAEHEGKGSIGSLLSDWTG